MSFQIMFESGLFFCSPFEHFCSLFVNYLPVINPLMVLACLKKKKNIIRCDDSLQLHTASVYVELGIFGH